jgi:S-adenosylmethionine:diacylglycerol 3-amino-3-carboxypropyl transferase
MTATPWERGRFDARRGARKVLFGRMYEDCAVELSAFAPGGRVFCIASAGDTAMALAGRHEVVAVDVNPVQLSYAADRLAGAPAVRGAAERVMDFGRAFAPVLGWTRGRVRKFLEMDEPAAQLAFFQRELDTRRFRAAFDALFSAAALGRVYASPLLAFLPRRFGAVLRGRMERCFAIHPNRDNPYARALFLGELPAAGAPAGAKSIRLECADAAAFLENEPAGGFTGFSLSNILDGATAAYRARLVSAVRRAGAPAAVAVLRSFAEPPLGAAANRAADDRSLLWGIVDVQPVARLE